MARRRHLPLRVPSECVHGRLRTQFDAVQRQPAAGLQCRRRLDQHRLGLSLRVRERLVRRDVHRRQLAVQQSHAAIVSSGPLGRRTALSLRMQRRTMHRRLQAGSHAVLGHDAPDLQRERAMDELRLPIGVHHDGRRQLVHRRLPTGRSGVRPAYQRQRRRAGHLQQPGSVGRQRSLRLHLHLGAVHRLQPRRHAMQRVDAANV